MVNLLIRIHYFHVNIMAVIEFVKMMSCQSVVLDVSHFLPYQSVFSFQIGNLWITAYILLSLGDFFSRSVWWPGSWPSISWAVKCCDDRSFHFTYWCLRNSIKRWKYHRFKKKNVTKLKVKGKTESGMWKRKWWWECHQLNFVCSTIVCWVCPQKKGL